MKRAHGRQVARRQAHARQRKTARQGWTGTDQTEFEELLAAASGSTSLPLSDRNASWDSGAATKSLSEGQYGSAHFWRDPDGDPKTLAAYKLPFASASGGTLTAIWKGVTSAAGAVQGARGGVSIPSGDVPGVKSRINSYYAKARQKYNDDSIKAPWEAAANETPEELLAYAEVRLENETDYEERLAYWRHELSLTADAALDEDLATFETALEVVTLPDEMQPSETLPDENPSPKDLVPKEQPVNASILKWEATFVPEGKLTEDGRALAPDTTKWRELPLSLMAMTETSEGGHIGAELAGRIDEIFRNGNLVLARGIFNSDDYGNEIASKVDNKSLTGLSVDLAVEDLAFVPRSFFDDEGNLASDWQERLDEQPEMDLLDILFGTDEDTVLLITDSTIGMATVCPFPAFGDAEIHMAASGQRRVTMTLKPQTFRVWVETAATHPSNNYEGPDATANQDQVAPEHMPKDEGGCAPGMYENEGGTAANSDATGVWTFNEASGAWTVTAGGTGAGSNSLQASATAAPSPLVVVGRAGVQAKAVEDEAGFLTAAAAGLAPVKPPREWFADPQLDGPTAPTLTDEGRFYGHAATWDVCHIGIPGVCTTAPHSNADYRYYLLKQVECDDGSMVDVGTITLDTGHADPRMTRVAATAHYDNTGCAVADVVVGEDEYGIWFSGALRPDMDASRVRDVRGSVLSGDWRSMDGNLELVALLAVNVPGFPIPRQETAALVASAAGDLTGVYSLVAAGVFQVEAFELGEVQRIATEALDELRSGSGYVPSANGQQGWIGVDLDGTLASRAEWDGNLYTVGPPVQAMVDRVKAWLEEGKDVRIFTSRAGELPVQFSADKVRKAVDDWAMEHIGAVLPLTATKDMDCLEIWDDRAVNVVADTGELLCEDFGGKPSKGTRSDKRLKENKPKGDDGEA